VGKRVEKWKGEFDLDICPGATEFLVTPLLGTAPKFLIFNRYNSAVITRFH